MAIRLSVNTDHPSGPVLVDQNGDPVEGVRITNLTIKGIGDSDSYLTESGRMMHARRHGMEIQAEVLIDEIYGNDAKGGPAREVAPMHWSGRPLRMVDMNSENVEKPGAEGTIERKGKGGGDDSPV